jgi:DNA topoisomerase-3
VVLERNYLDVYTYDKWSDAIVPVFILDETISPSALDMNESKTTKPSNFNFLLILAMLTESDLISLMDKNGIGTDATIHGL